MRRIITSKLLRVVLLACLVAPVEANEDLLTGTSATRYLLSRLNMLGSVLMIGAHPDDEDNAVLA
jgi:hypothetical protein